MKNLPIVFMFSGQGSQYYQMGKMLFEHNKIFKNHMIDADSYFIKMTGNSLIKILYDSNKRQTDLFLDFSLTHPAIFMIEYALTKALIDNHIQPDFLLGNSVGEVTAAVM